MARPRYKSFSTPKVVSRGKLSKRVALPKWSPKREANDRLRRVKAPL